ncbi:FecR family protein [Mariniphaga anaerophila]|uniref:FecR family protein n=1 Tax=Mariniphaga anaerophila TaxID=1484053 RepID=A0A1M5A9C4_9BACT|nr:FecR domain-containing protein [Mariniphaga anaerophila]SHF26472.1 FecR family protein [Mariniphaga anaerophila]
MRSLFRKYYYSVLRPDEFDKFTDSLSDKKNELIISGLMKSLWEARMKDDEITHSANPELWSRIKEAVLLDKQEAIHRKMKFYVWGLRIAAVLVIILLFGNIFFMQKSEQNKLTTELQTITTPYGAKTSFTLPDSSVVWLNSGSTFSYPLNFDKTRAVTLVGEAYFKVEKSNMPFVVSTGYGDVEVKGTSFNVKAYTDDNAFETTLEEGAVVFKASGTTSGVTLNPGEQMVKAGNGFVTKNVETKYFTSWKDGLLFFNREPFPSFITKLERWYNIKIEYTDPALDELWYTGTLEMESVSEVMEMISKAAPVTYSFNAKTRVFSIKPEENN